MTLDKIIYTIREIEKSSGLNSRFDDNMLIDMINRYREVHIGNVFREKRELNPLWFTNFGIVTPVNVNSADSPEIAYTSIALGKITLPSVITLPGVRTIRMRSASKHQRIEEIDSHLLFKMIETDDEYLKEYSYYFVENGLDYYIYPTGTKLHLSMILSNPLEGYTYGAAINPVDGSVISAQGTKRNLYMFDHYPACGTVITALILDILTKELHIEKSSIPDITVDNAETDNLVKSPL